MIYILQQSPKASLTVSLGEKARSGTVTAKSPNETQRIATAKIPLTGKTKKEKKTETKKEAAAMWSHCPTGVTVKIALVAM